MEEGVSLLNLKCLRPAGHLVYGKIGQKEGFRAVVSLVSGRIPIPEVVNAAIPDRNSS